MSPADPVSNLRHPVKDAHSYPTLPKHSTPRLLRQLASSRKHRCFGSSIQYYTQRAGGLIGPVLPDITYAHRVQRAVRNPWSKHKMCTILATGRVRIDGRLVREGSQEPTQLHLGICIPNEAADVYFPAFIASPTTERQMS